MPDDEPTGEDDVLMWYLRSMHGVKAHLPLRRNASYWSWWLTLQGYTDAEIQAAMLSHVAGESLAWLARVRGLPANDERVAQAVQELIAPSGKLVPARQRSAMLKRWAKLDVNGTRDLAALAASALVDLGTRSSRVDVVNSTLGYCVSLLTLW